MKVVIVTENKVGDGHYKAARALEHAFRSLFPLEVETKILYGLRCIHPLVEWVIVHIYFAMLKHFPRVWGFTYKQAKRIPFTQRFGFALKLLSWLRRERPDLILCTHPACVPAFSYIKKRGKHLFRLGVVLTDYGFHPFAVSREVDYYFVPHEDLKQRLISRYAIAPERIYHYGIPLGPEFNCPCSSATGNPRQRDPDEKFHVLLMGGGCGFGPIAEILHMFRKHPSFRFTVICGKNEKLYRRLTEQYRDQVRVLGYVQNMKKWIYKADVVISKPGGLTIAETLACGKPLVLIRPIPGQEEWNRSFIQKHRLGVCVDHLSDLPGILADLKENTQRWTGWRKRILHNQPAGSSEKIVRTVMNHPL